jgi:hypothetical protein
MKPDTAVRSIKVRARRGQGDGYIADFLENVAEGKTILQLGKDEKVFSQEIRPRLFISSVRGK